MTLGECIQRVDALRPNTAAEGEKARCLIDLDRELEQVFFPRFQGEREWEAPRRWPEDKAVALLASGPYEGFYLHRLIAWLELMDQEWDAYNLHTALANQMENQFKKEWARTHLRRSGRR